MPFLLTLILLFSVVTYADALEGPQPTAMSVVNGDVLYWEGEEVVVKEISGREVRLHVTAETKSEGVARGRLKTGDKIAVQVNSDGQALSITLQIPDSWAGVAPPGLR
jgi:endonuclease YncB( thermonuclease family)